MRSASIEEKALHISMVLAKKVFVFYQPKIESNEKVQKTISSSSKSWQG